MPVEVILLENKKGLYNQKDWVICSISIVEEKDLETIVSFLNTAWLSEGRKIELQYANE